MNEYIIIQKYQKLPYHQRSMEEVIIRKWESDSSNLFNFAQQVTHSYKQLICIAYLIIKISKKICI